MTVAETAADIDDSIKQKRIRVSLKNETVIIHWIEQLCRGAGRKFEVGSESPEIFIYLEYSRPLPKTDDFGFLAKKR